MPGKILVVDDSALMRKRLREIISAAGYEVATARDGVDALEQLRDITPDAITMDIHMPEMNGLECLERIMTEKPTPVLMLSSLTSEAADATLEAFRLGAVDAVQKPGGTISLNIEEIETELVAKIAAALASRASTGEIIRRASAGAPAKVDRSRERLEARKRTAKNAAPSTEFPIVLIGVSTGGPRLVERLLSELDPDLPAAVVIAQHMPGAFTATFARRLNDAVEIPVSELNGRVPLRPGACFVCRGDADAVLLQRESGVHAHSIPIHRGFPWHPSVDRLVTSALETVGPDRLVGALLTGMGDDGAKSMAELHRQGGRTIAESEESALVYGMPRALTEAGGASEILHADEIGERLNEIVFEMSQQLARRA
ncbi:MAG: chemotaxis-specific protein-glutamate methyltransferase CheB [Neomegalonema sp.]|nr:chemotaxis-specific protein-glutamate methyltransferase CheB [Neomegalonema sp.]